MEGVSRLPALIGFAALFSSLVREIDRSLRNIHLRDQAPIPLNLCSAQ